MSQGSVAAQTVYAYNTPFTTAITFQNVSTAATAVNFEFYNAGSSQAFGLYRSLDGAAGSSLYVGNSNVGVASGFLGSTVLATEQDVLATAIQLAPSSSSVKNRPISNAFTVGYTPVSAQVLLASVLKNKFNTTSKFAIQNVSNQAVNMTINIYNADNPSAPPITINYTNVPVGAAKHVDMNSAVSASSFNGSAVVTANGDIAGTVLELSTNGYAAKAFEGISAGATTVYMPTALCRAFHSNPALGTTTAYAVQNVATSGSTNVTVTYYPGGATDTATIAAGAKQSFNGCVKVNGTSINGDGFTGSAKIVSSGSNIIAIGKAYKSSDATYSTAFIGESAGAQKLALPYVRYSEYNYTNGKNQRAFIAIQNISSSSVSGVQVKYYNTKGELVGTHSLNSIAGNQKANSTAKDAALAAGHSQIELYEFGNPESGQAGYGGSAIIQGPAGAQLVATARIATWDFNASAEVAEDYNAFRLP
jgi:hypothetical protein